MPTNPLTLAQRFRSQLTQIDVLQGQQLLSAYAPIRNELNASIDALLMEIELMGNPSVSRVQRSDRYKRLMDELGEKLVQFSLLLMVVMRGASHQGFVVGAENGAAMLGAYGLRANVVSADAVEQLAAFLDPSGPLYARIRNLAPYTVQRIADAISDGVAMGQNPRTIAAAIDRAFGMGLTDSLRMTRTVQVYSYRYANHASYMANGIESWTWFSRLDPGRTCMSCVQMHGSVHPASETLNDHHNGLAEVPGNVILSDAPTAFVTHRYDGDIIVIRAASGKFLSVTPDHPVLTRRGWVAAQFVKVGDNVISNGGAERAAAMMHPDKQHVPARVEDVARSFNMLRLGRVPKSAKNFDSKRVGGDIDVVFVDRFLWGSLDAPRRQHITETLFGGGSGIGVGLAGLGSLAQSFGRSWRSPNGVLGSLYQLLAFGFAHPHIAQPNSFRPRVASDIVLSQNASNNNARDAISFGQGFLGGSRNVLPANAIRRQSDLIPGVGGYFPALNRRNFGFTPKEPLSLEKIREALFTSVPTGGSGLAAVAGQVVFDSVVEVSRRSFSGHVYSLQTNSEWYYSNSIVSHNCLAIPNVAGANLVGENGEAWFGKQSDSTQLQMMGPGRFQAWKDGALRFGELSTTHHDEVYGDMRIVAPLKGVVK